MSYACQKFTYVKKKENGLLGRLFSHLPRAGRHARLKDGLSYASLSVALVAIW